MITDGLIGMVHGLFAALVGLLPVMPDRPEAVTHLWNFMTKFDNFLPMTEVVGFLPTIGGVLVGLALWRAVRAFLPGG